MHQSRRQFLKATAAAGALANIPWTTTALADKPVRADDIIMPFQSLPGDKAINSYEFQAIKRTYDVDPDFVHRPRYGTNQYSETFAEWLVERIGREPEFVSRAREHYRALRVSESRSRG